MQALVTGHTGFKGSWLSVLLAEKGYTVHGLSFDQSRLATGYLGGFETLFATSRQIDMGKKPVDLANYIGELNPDVIFHLAAVSQVKDCQDNPSRATSTNVIGTANLLQAAAELGIQCPIIVATTDKVYAESDLKMHSHSEESQLSGSEAYSITKVSADQIVEAYARVFKAENWGVARAGNVIGGGDRASFRLMPEVISGLLANEEVLIRNPSSTRPWQHVLDCVYGYYLLSEYLRERPGSSAWNFGPPQEEVVSVADFLSIVSELEPNFRWAQTAHFDRGFYESQYLSLDSSKARATLGWQPKLSIQDSLKAVIRWEKSLKAGALALDISREQTSEYLNRM
ncbi:CDP-glucose 4,6-dehydratase [Aquiluna sp.]|nr:CDP-glucose 4,6-dehydratase [Aquiluna sp.]